MPDPLKIHKLHGTGNDFVVLRADHPLASERWAAFLCDRHRGVGADGVLILDDSAAYDVRLTIINADGSRPEMCGNGVRCVARYLVEVEGVSDRLVIESDAGPRPVEVVSKGPGSWQVAVDMGPASIEERTTTLELGGSQHLVRKVDMGNPHAVAFVDDMPTTAEVDRWGRWVNDAHDAFPNGVNLEFVTVEESRLDVIVWERGVGRTQACGTGACAVAAAAWHEGRVDRSTVTVGLPGGDLTIERRPDSIWMTGDVEAVFVAEVDEEWVEQRKGARQEGRAD